VLFKSELRMVPQACSKAVPDLGSGCTLQRRAEPTLSKDNCWRGWIAPKLGPVGLGWGTFQVMRSTHASLMRELKVDHKVAARQLGHSVDVDLNVYSKTAFGPRR